MGFVSIEMSQYAANLETLAQGLRSLAERAATDDPETDANADAPPIPERPSPPIRRSRPPLPEPRLVRQIIRLRQMRGQFFERSLFADPAWDMLLDLTAARAEHKRVSVTSLCIASGVPPTTALRWIGQMIEAGLLVRRSDTEDGRRAYIGLSESTAEAMARYFATIGNAAGRMV